MMVEKGAGGPAEPDMMGCLRIVIVVALLVPVVFAVVLYALIPDFFNPPNPPRHQSLALVLSHELSGYRFRFNRDYSAFPEQWCNIAEADDLKQFDPNSCAVVMPPRGREPFYCSKRSGKSCFEIYIPEEFWQREDVKRGVVGGIAAICDIMDARLPAQGSDSGEGLPRYYRDGFSCDAPGPDVDYHLVIIPKAVMPAGVPKTLERSQIADHLKLTWNAGPW